MRNTVLVDTGVIVALLNMRDTQHQAITDLFIERDAGRGTPLITTWPVITEACSFLPDNRQGQVLDWVSDSGIGIVSIDAGLAFMRAQMSRYDDLPCDFADASLLYAASVTGVRAIWTLDRDFLVYRLPDRSRFVVIPGGRP